MTGRVLLRGGMVLAAAALAGLAVYFAVAGLDKADQFSGLIGEFVGLAGLVLSGYGLVLTRRGTAGTPPPSVPQGGQSTTDPTLTDTGGVSNLITGGVFFGEVKQTRDYFGGVPEPPTPGRGSVPAEPESSPSVPGSSASEPGSSSRE